MRKGSRKKKEDLSGKVFGYWQVIEESIPSRTRGFREYICECGACGNKYIVREDNLIKGRSTKCACCSLGWKRHRRQVVEDE